MDRTNLHYDSSQKTVGKCVLGVFWGGGPVRIQNEGFKAQGFEKGKSRPAFVIILSTQLSKTCSKCKAGAKHAGQGLLSALFPALTLTSVTIFFLCVSLPLCARALPPLRMTLSSHSHSHSRLHSFVRSLVPPSFVHILVHSHNNDDENGSPSSSSS